MGTARAEQLRVRLAQGLAARPVLREALRALGAGGFSLVLAGAGLLSAHVPLALAPVCVLPFGPAAVCAYLGAVAGYAVFWGLSAALEPVAAGFLMLASINIDEVLTDEELKAVANESEPAERKAKPEDGPRTVVVAEDEAVNRMDLVAMLEDNGYEVVGQAANGEEAVELTRKYRPDVVCMDVKMPRMDGITAAGIICDENIAPVVMLTAFSQTDLVKKATGAGAMAYVTKPYEESKLLPTLEVAMGRFAEINDLLDSVERSERKLKETTDQLKETEEKLKKAEDTLEERKLVDRAKGLLMDKADFSEQGAFRWIQKTSMDQRIPKKRLAMAIIAKYGEQKSEAEDER